MKERLQKIIARAGIAARRKAEELIEEGRVFLNGRVARLGDKADPEKDVIKVDGEVIKPLKKKVYILLYKPLGYVTTKSDEKHRPTVMDLLQREEKKALFPVGRLDINTEGLLLITNDGEFANLISNPKTKVEKTYLVKVRGVPDKRSIERLLSGVIVENRRLSAKKISLLGHKNNAWLKVVLTEGKKNQIRRMFEKVGHPVVKLKRIKIGNLEIGELKPGEYRRLTPQEVEGLKKLASKKREEK